MNGAQPHWAHRDSQIIGALRFSISTVARTGA
jgi:hypothetical protein